VSFFGAIAWVAAGYWGGGSDRIHSNCLFLVFNRLVSFFSISCDSNHTGLFSRHQEVWLPVPAGDRKVERIHGWWMPAATNAKVLLYLHGNGINIRLTLPTLIGFIS